MIARIMVPTAIIQTASDSFALFFPTSIRPAIHREGDVTMMETIIWSTKWSRFIANSIQTENKYIGIYTFRNRVSFLEVLFYIRFQWCLSGNICSETISWLEWKIVNWYLYRIQQFLYHMKTFIVLNNMRNTWKKHIVRNLFWVFYLKFSPILNNGNIL